MLRDPKQLEHLHNGMFHGFDFDTTILRIGAMNMSRHGVENPDVSYRDSLAKEHGEDAGRYFLILANAPLARANERVGGGSPGHGRWRGIARPARAPARKDGETAGPCPKP